MIDVAVRPATAADREAVDRLRTQARAEIASARGGPQLLASRPLDAHDGGATTFVATVDGVVLAHAVVAVTTPTAVLTELFTEPAARGVGLGYALLEAVTDAARRAGCTGLDSVALPGDRSTKNFFEAHGLRARLLVVHRDLDPA